MGNARPEISGEIAHRLASGWPVPQTTGWLHWLRTGTPIGGRKLDLMEDVATSRFSHLTDSEIAALHVYLLTLLRPR
jgi:hypothetical protein